MSRASATGSSSTNFTKEYTELIADTKKAAERNVCPFCKENLGKVGMAVCNCEQHDIRCGACGKEWHYCVGGLVKQSGHPCWICLGGSLLSDVKKIET